MRVVAGCLALTLFGCGAVRQEVAVNFQMDPTTLRQVGKVDVSVHLVR